MKLSQVLREWADKLETLEGPLVAGEDFQEQKEEVHFTPHAEFEKFVEHVSGLENEFRDEVHELQGKIAVVENMDVDDLEAVSRWYQSTDLNAIERIADVVDAQDLERALADLEDVKARTQDVDLDDLEANVTSTFEGVQFLLKELLGIEVESPFEVHRALQKIREQKVAASK